MASEWGMEHGAWGMGHEIAVTGAVVTGSAEPENRSIAPSLLTGLTFSFQRGNTRMESRRDLTT
ncbi:uncharacterized protein MYCFIDRAFT_178252 [Pseudocercospora fijiensis CIRAD86]|uniref:Uncharacterized protein n=1 Tax=Pseudocercospora fijiensis (strain CIRAD86) TaxID=383855 RepID=M2YPL7_PSEFD|nr:uncharacterized protein MYCFIDRAFT_178252 [Pseudocercospora fijiensis CIRAD86]EME79680.1 hypothetical protein MYCFIDRAFT_178252 [Pseudocercospora fijiensis CIRAD86]